MEKQPFQRISIKRTSNARFDVVEERVAIGDHIQPYFYTEIREGVCVLPIYRGQVALLYEYRHPVSSWQWEIPGGVIDEGEAPEQAAVRELREETGLICDSVRSLGAVYTSFGSSNEKIHLFLANCSTQKEASPEEAETFTLHLFSQEQFRAMIADGVFMHGAGLAAWARYEAGQQRLRFPG